MAWWSRIAWLVVCTGLVWAAKPVHVVRVPPPGKFYHGVFPGGTNGMGGDIRPADVERYQKAAGKRVAWVYFCNNWYESRAFPVTIAKWIRANGSVPYIRLMLMSSAAIPTPDPIYNLSNILSGAFDKDLRRWMRAAREYGSPVIAEYGVEVNGWWFPWNGLWNRSGESYAVSVGRFREAYRHIVRLAREEKADNILWVFHVDPWDEPVVDWNHFENYYPGDEWVDWVGVSVYGRQVPRDKRAVSFAFQMDWAYRRLTKLTDKPVVVCEFGNIEDQNQAAWATAALTDMLRGRWPKLIGFSWWNAAFENDTVTEKPSHMRVQGNRLLARVFRKYVGHEPAVLSRVKTAPAVSRRFADEHDRP